MPYHESDHVLNIADNLLCGGRTLDDQENLNDQLKNGVRAFHAPASTLLANWAYMVMVSLAWSLKAWT